MISTCKHIMIGGDMNNTNSCPECPMASQPLVGVAPPHSAVLSSRRSRVHDPGAGFVIAGHCRLSVREWLGLQSIQQVEEQQGKEQREAIPREMSVIRIYAKRPFIVYKSEDFPYVHEHRVAIKIMYTTTEVVAKPHGPLLGLTSAFSKTLSMAKQEKRNGGRVKKK